MRRGRIVAADKLIDFAGASRLFCSENRQFLRRRAGENPLDSRENVLAKFAVPFLSDRCNLRALRVALVSGVATAVLAGLASPADAAPRRMRFYDPGYYYGSPTYIPARTARSAASPKREKPEPKKDSGFGEMPKGPLQLVVSIGSQHVTLFSNGVRVAQGPVSTGVPGHPTPMGVFSVIEKDRYHHSNIYSGAPMPYMQRITWSGVALHEGVLPGYPASHGCIRMSHDFALKLWPITKLGVRVIVSRSDVAPVEFDHPKLLKPKLKPPDAQVAMNGATDGLSAKPAVKLAQVTIPVTDAAEVAPDLPKPASETAPEFAKPAAEAELPKPAAAAAPEIAKPAAEMDLPKPAAEAGPERAKPAAEAVEPAKPAAAAVEDTAESATPVVEKPAASVKAAEPAQGAEPAQPAAAAAEEAPKATGTIPPARPADVPALPSPIDLRKSVEAPEPATPIEAAPAATPSSPAEATPAGAEKPPPAVDDPMKPPAPRTKAAEQPVKRSGQVAVFVSRKEKRIFIRQGFIPLFEMPIEIGEPDRPLGTHVFTAMAVTDGGAGMRWNLMTVPNDTSSAPVIEHRDGRRKSRDLPVVIHSNKPPSTAAEALDRIRFPKEALDRIGELLIPGSSLVVSDEGLGRETGRYTEFIVLTR